MSKNIATFLSIFIFALSLHSVANDGLAAIDKLIAANRHADALKEIERLVKAIPPEDKLVAWELNFGGEVIFATRGRECFYYLLSSNRSKTAPGVTGALPRASVNHGSSGWRSIVVCVSLKDGKIRWSRRVNGLVNLAVDSRTDTLCLFREKLMTLDAKSGKVLERHDIPNRGRGVKGLIWKGGLVVPLPRGRDLPSLESEIPLYNAVKKEVKKVKLSDYCLLSPKEDRRLTKTARGYDCINTESGKKLWSFDGKTTGLWPPLWHKGSPIFAAGTERGRGVVNSMDMRLGRARWSLALRGGRYDSGGHQLSGGGYPSSWSPLASAQKHILALGGTGHLYIVDPDTGKVAGDPKLARNFIAMPFQHSDHIIVPSFRHVRAYSLKCLLNPDAAPAIELAARRAQCLFAVGKAAESLKAMDDLTERAPQSRKAWKARAFLFGRVGNEQEETYSLCRALAVSNSTQDAVLLKKAGLLRFYDLRARPSWYLTEHDKDVYIGTHGGDVWRVDTSTLKASVVTQVDFAVRSLRTTPALVIEKSHRKYPVVVKPTPRKDRIPDEWYTQGGEERYSQAFTYCGRRFRTMVGGIRILNGSKMTDLPAKIKGVEEWSIHIGDGRALGYGAGVFELDDDLRPVRWLIRPTVEGKRAKEADVMQMATTANAIGLVVGSRNGAMFRVHSRDGKLLNQVPLGRYISGWASSQQLIPLGNGFLFSDRQLVWLGAGKDRRIWRFGPALTRTSTNKWGDRWRFFSTPLLADGCIYVAGLDARLYIFDARRVIRAATKQATEKK